MIGSGLPKSLYSIRRLHAIVVVAVRATGHGHRGSEPSEKTSGYIRLTLPEIQRTEIRNRIFTGREHGLNHGFEVDESE
ncbi:hypothetical protein BO86DRAFT_206816 [Aspergillus japonicus CBS 114.51]|uniref:Uncharacterized protein n=1 Tax=Aspergillus japonicus CBS 114.51 TaxID=1448312 RepID=A0A8T8WPU8_ASPJA|nr:hypothetical protein BO86DRAFT_206816 [Aspergillus japonicus CBS 114.51]RAH77693.1 hypothetical protein BO86DRAFT_206816 [Aspergillus japonicus CBS 114.51]